MSDTDVKQELAEMTRDMVQYGVRKEVSSSARTVARSGEDLSSMSPVSVK